MLVLVLVLLLLLVLVLLLVLLLLLLLTLTLLTLTLLRQAVPRRLRTCCLKDSTWTRVKRYIYMYIHTHKDPCCEFLE